MSVNANESQSDGLSAEQREMLDSFQDVTGLNPADARRILERNTWNLQVALNRVLDGANDVMADNGENAFDFEPAPATGRDFEDLPSTVPASSDVADDSAPQLRNRAPAARSGQAASASFDWTQNHDNAESPWSQNEDPGSSSMIVSAWNHLNWLVRFPFSFLFQASQILFDFFAAIVNPALYYDTTGTVERFVQEFESQFGTVHPTFSTDTHSAVIAKGKREIRFVLLYLHSPKHRDTARFCREVIATEGFKNFIVTQNTIFWACNVFYPEGRSASQSVSFTSYPFLYLVGLKNNKMLILKQFEGFQPLDLTIRRIKSAMNNNESHLISALMERETLSVNSLIRQQQDAAFERSLRADQEKDRKAREEAEQKAQEERLKAQEEQEKADRLAKIMELKVTLVEKLDDEPEPNDAEIIKLLFRLPSGKRLERRFLKTNPVKLLYFFVFCNEESLINFKLKTNFPTRELPGHSPIPEIDLDSEEMNRQLADCELESNIVLFVHDLDA